MGRAMEVTRSDLTAQELRHEAGRARDGRVVRRLLAIALVLEDAARKTAAENCGMDRQTLRDWEHRYNAEGVAGLANRRGGGARPRLTPEQQARFVTWVEEGPDPARDGVVRWRCCGLQARVEAEFGVNLHERTIGKHLAKHGFRRLSVRPEHPGSDPAAQQTFKKNFRDIVADALPHQVRGKPLEIWFQDEARVGQQGTLTRKWARRGTRYKWSYIFGAACPEQGIAAGFVLPHVDTEAMNLHLAEIAKAVAPNSHAVLVLDGAGWHGARALRVPDNITLLPLPPQAPELNPIENVWQYLRANKLAITDFDSYAEIVDKCCEAWNFFADCPNAITSITSRDWATVNA